MYGDYSSWENKDLSVVVTEDSGAGNDFFSDVCQTDGIKCTSADGKSNMFAAASAESAETGNILLIADGAAFGPEMGRITRLMRENSNIHLFLPESFEWLILASGIFTSRELDGILQDPPDYVESERYFSWERFFTDYLVRISQGTYLQYTKKRLNPNYLQDSNKSRILEHIPKCKKKMK